MTIFVKLSAVGLAAIRQLHTRSSEKEYYSCGYLCEVVSSSLTKNSEPQYFSCGYLCDFVSAVGSATVTHEKQ